MTILFALVFAAGGAVAVDNHNKCSSPQTDKVVAYCDNLAEIGEIDNLGWMDVAVPSISFTGDH